MASDEWQIVHAYFKYVDWGLLNPIGCMHCNYALTRKADKDFNPVLVCAMCNTEYTPGSELLNFMEEAVSGTQNKTGKD